MGELVPLVEARQRVLAGRSVLAPQPLPLGEALGCVIAEDIVASEAVPPFDNSSMDGYALRASDTSTPPAVLDVVGTVMAGSVLGQSIGPGQAARIMTGAPMPDGADAVCMIERAIGGPDDPKVTIEHSVTRGDFVRHIGGDIRAGELVFPAGTVLAPGCLGVLRSLGLRDVLVFPRPRVGVLSTGDELTEDAAVLGPGKIRESNRASLLALVAQSGFLPIDLGIVGDDEETVVKILLQASTMCDAIVTSGGVSVGDKDVIKAVLSDISAGSMQWMQVAIRPAKPFAWGSIGPSATPLFGLPGNPVSAMVSFELFARPVLRTMAGFTDLDRPVVEAIADEALSRLPDGKTHLVRARAHYGPDGRVHARSAGGQESNQLAAMARANALVLLDDGNGVVAGATIPTMLLDQLPVNGAPSWAGMLPEGPRAISHAI